MSAASAARQPVVLVTGADLAAPALELLKDYRIEYAGKTPSDADIAELCRVHNPVGVIVRYGKVGEAAMAAAPALRVVSKHGSGTDTIDGVAARARGIAVRAAAGANAVAVAEHALALLLACAKSVPKLNARMHAGCWDKATHKSIELAGMTIGLVGVGAIGGRFARMVQALDMRVIAYDPYAPAMPEGVAAVALEDLWPRADVLSFHCPLTADNKGMLDAAVLQRCKRGVIVINTARGGLVDEAALLEAVRSGQVAMAGLDSFAIEPMTAGHPFQGEERIILSPHIGGVSANAYVNMGLFAARNVVEVLRG